MFTSYFSNIVRLHFEKLLEIKIDQVKYITLGFWSFRLKNKNWVLYNSITGSFSFSIIKPLPLTKNSFLLQVAKEEYRIYNFRLDGESHLFTEFPKKEFGDIFEIKNKNQTSFIDAENLVYTGWEEVVN